MSVEFKKWAEDYLYSHGFDQEIQVSSAYTGNNGEFYFISLKVKGVDSVFTSPGCPNKAEAIERALQSMCIHASLHTIQKVAKPLTNQLKSGLTSEEVVQQMSHESQSEFDSRVAETLSQKIKELYTALGLTEDNIKGLGVEWCHKHALEEARAGREAQLKRLPELVAQLNQMELERDKYRTTLLNINSISADAAS